MAIRKTVSFTGPYVGKTFQDLTQNLLGQDGYLAGAAASDDGVNITLGPYSFVQSGIVCIEDSVSTLAAPAGAQPWFVLASVIDDDPASGVLLQATNDVTQVGEAVVLACKMNGGWFHPSSSAVSAVRRDVAPEPGKQAGFRTTANINSGVVSSLQLNRGVAVDARGDVRRLGGAGSAAVVQTFTPLGPSGLWNRDDHLILRKRAAGSEAVLAMGNALGSATAMATPASLLETGVLVTRPSVFGNRGAGHGRMATAWSNGPSLRLSSAVGATTLGGPGSFGPITVYTGSASVANTWLAGQRASDGALIVVFTDGNNVKVAALSADNGSVLNAPVRIDVQPNACTRLRAVIDADGYLHVVYQHDEGRAPPNQQIYYTKRAITVGQFGTAAISARLINTVDSTNNDTWPSIGVDSKRRVHVAYTTGSGSNDVGQLRYVVLDANGGIVSRATYATYGHQPDPNGPGGIVEATALVESVARPQVVVTAHDEVNVFVIVKRAAAGAADHVGLLQTGFQTRLGFAILVLSGLYAPSGAGTDTLVSLGAASDELGQLMVAANWAGAGVLLARLDTVIAPTGVLGDSYLDEAHPQLTWLGNTDKELVVAPGPAGDLLFGVLNGTAATVWTSAAKSGGLAPTPHPDDVFLSGAQVDVDAAARPSVAETGYQLFSTRPKKMNYPVLVGDEGDYQGYGAIGEALAVANRRGGHVVVRAGTFEPTGALVLRSGVQVEGESHVLVDLSGGGSLQLGVMSEPAACTIAGNVVTVTAAVSLGATIRVGDLCEFFATASTGLFRVRRILDDARFVVDGAPTGATVLVYTTGTVLRNFTIRGSNGGGGAISSAIVLAEGLFGGLIDTVKIVGTLTAASSFVSAGVRLTACRESVMRDVDVRGLGGAPNTCGIRLDRGSDNVVDRALLGDADGRYLKIEVSEASPHVVHCSSSLADHARFQIDGPRTSSPVFLSASSGRVEGDVGNVVTHVGKVISSVTGRGAAAGALQFQDENTMTYQAGVPLDLTASTPDDSRFNGATPHVLVPSVNERIRRSGDTMTGELGVASLMLSEMTDPQAPPAGSIRLYVRSNGEAAGQSPPRRRTQLELLMPDGTSMVVAHTEPV